MVFVLAYHVDDIRDLALNEMLLIVSLNGFSSVEQTLIPMQRAIPRIFILLVWT